MESISVKKSEIIRWRVAEVLRKGNKFVKSLCYRMEVIKGISTLFTKKP